MRAAEIAAQEMEQAFKGLPNPQTKARSILKQGDIFLLPRGEEVLTYERRQFVHPEELPSLMVQAESIILQNEVTRTFSSAEDAIIFASNIKAINTPSTSL